MIVRIDVMKISLGKFLLLLFGLALFGGVVYGFLPRAVDVDMGLVSRGPLRVVVSEDGKTRIREKYVVSMPFSGRIERITLDPGDPVSGGESIIATIYPTSPELLNERTRVEADARVKSAESAVRRATSAVEKARSEKEWAETTANRIRKLAEQKATTEERKVDAELLLRTRESDVTSAEFALDMAEFELKQAEAGLIRATPNAGVSAEDWNFNIISPITGKVLRVLQESAATLTPGAPLIEVGDPTDLEMEIDVLSQDAVRIRPGNRVYVEHWGGEKPLVGTVRLIEPAGFTKISALGVEEQRVNVIADFNVPASERSTLGDAFRVDAQIATWESDDVLQVPASALFRSGEDWCVFVANGGHRASRRVVKVGHRSAQAAEVLEGLVAGDHVILHPGYTITDGSLVVLRSQRAG